MDGKFNMSLSSAYAEDVRVGTGDILLPGAPLAMTEGGDSWISACLITNVHLQASCAQDISPAAGADTTKPEFYWTVKEG